MKILLLILLFPALSIASNADANTQKIQDHLNTWANKHGVVGAALEINADGYCYGYSDRDLKIKVDKNTEFGIGSITKTFVSVVLLKLESRGKINIHDPITKYFPEYSKLKNVSIKSLMQMTAGFNDASGTSSVTPEQAIKESYQNYNPKLSGTWRYSNVSYQLLGLLIERVTHQSLAKNIANDITKPLHLNHIYFPTIKLAEKLKEYQDNNVKTSNFNIIFAEGGLVSNAHDLTVFINHLFIKKDLLAKKQYDELTTFVKTPTHYYAFTHTPAPQFGLGVFRWKIPGVGYVLTYPGVLKNGFTSAYTVYGKNIIVTQSNTYNKNDFTLLWPYRSFTKDIIKKLVKL